LPFTISSARKETEIQNISPADKWGGQETKVSCSHNPERSYQSVN